MPNLKCPIVYLKKKNLLAACNLELESVRRGFTLIEVLLVFSIISILSVASIFAYTSFNTKQEMNNSVQEVLQLLRSAKSKAQSQITPSTCTSLRSYQVMRCAAGPLCLTSGATASSYELHAVCSNGRSLIDAKTLSPNVTFDGGSATTLSFEVLTGGASAGTFVLTNGSSTQSISVSSYGQISHSQN